MRPTSTGGHWEREEPQFFNFLELRSNALRDPSIAHGLNGTVVSYDTNNDSGSYLIELPRGWRRTFQQLEATVEFVLMHGDLAVNGQSAPNGGYVSIPQGVESVDLASAGGGLALLLWNSGMPIFPPPYMTVSVLDCNRAPWQEAAGRPVPHGALFKSLRRPDFVGDFAGGPGGCLRLVCLTPGYVDARQHVHHECWEEMYVVRGDLLMPGRGIMTRGTYFANPQEYWHAPMYSYGGAVLLVQTDAPQGPWGLREYPEGEQIAEAYFDECSWVTEPRHESWQESVWSEWDNRAAHVAWRATPNWSGWDDVVGRQVASKFRARYRPSVSSTADVPALTAP